MQATVALGFCSRITPKMVGKIPADPVAIGAISNLFVSQSFDVTPCCDGPAPIIIEAQLGLLTVGKTPRSCSVQAPSRISLWRTGAFEGVKPTDPKPSQPITMTCST